MRALTVGSLFSGIGGIDLGLERAGMKVLWQVEQNEYCRRVLKKNFPGVVCWGDVEGFDRGCAKSIGGIPDVLAGGFPCQPFSTASRGRRVAKDLWPEMLRLVRELRPRFVVAENVAVEALEHAASDVSTLGYTCSIVLLPAALVGAPHERRRFVLVADANGNGESLFAKHAEMAGLSDLAGVASWAHPPKRLGVAHGIPSRVDRLRALGNAVVPQVAELVGRCIVAHARPAPKAPEGGLHDVQLAEFENDDLGEALIEITPVMFLKPPEKP